MSVDVIRARTQLWDMTSMRRPSQPRRGLVNLGNTCYLNSVLQCLGSTPIGAYFRGDAWLDSVVDRYTGGGQIAQGFTYVMRELVQSGVPYAVSPTNLKIALGRKNESFAAQSQQDANELLQTLIDGLHEETNSNGRNKVAHREIADKGTDEELAHHYWATYIARNRSIVVDLVAFQEKSVVHCPECGHAARSFSPLMSIQVPIPLLSRTVSVEDCLAAYCAPEVLDADSLYSCGKCNKKVRATKQLGFVGAPQVLIISLKRFKSYGNFADKINVPVAFQPQLDFSPFTTLHGDKSSGPPPVYNLVGIVNHQGNMHGGHYTADTKGMGDECWFYCSDEVVKPSTTPNFNLAYMLFYVKAH